MKAINNLDILKREQEKRASTLIIRGYILVYSIFLSIVKNQKTSVQLQLVLICT